MRSIQRLAAVAAIAVLGAACDGPTGFTATSFGNPGASGAITGVVTADGSGLGGVSVVALGARQDTAITSASGEYVLSSLGAGQYTVSVLVPLGYRLAAGQTGSQTVTVASGGTASASFALQSTTTAP